MRKRMIELMVDYDINQAELENEMALELDMETADRIVVLSLRNHCEYLSQEQRDIEDTDVVPGHKLADYFDNREIMAAMKKVLSYYGESV